jgi:membrane-associated phospholipid phosphatase
VFDFWRLPTVKLCFIFLGVAFAAAGIWSLNPPFSIDAQSFGMPVFWVAMCAAELAVSYVVYCRLAADDSRPAVAIKTMIIRFYDVAAAFGALLTFAPVAVLLSYLVFSAGFPMQDHLFAGLDERLGFDFVTGIASLNSNQQLGAFLTWSYQGCLHQIFLAVLLLAGTGRTAELWDFVAILLIGCLVTLVISGLLPAIGPYVHYGIDPKHYAMLNKIGPGVGQFHVADVLALNKGQYPVFVFGKNSGLITFPSYHALVACALIYSVRNFKLLFWPVAALNAAVLVSTVPIGGHYVVDVIGGVGVFAATLVLIDWVNGRRSLWVRGVERFRTVFPKPSGAITEAAE